MDNQTKYCSSCGKPVQLGQGFCANCGKSLAPQEPQMQPVPPIQAQTAVLPSNQKRKKWLYLGLAISFLVVSIVVLILVLTNIKGQDRTIMVYMIGSNLESEAAAASLDITEMKNANFDQEHTKVLIYTGGSKEWALDEINAEENAIFEVVDGQIKKKQTYEKSLMTEPKNLIGFVDYAYENYPADLYDLVLWDHGGGPIFGYGQDENSLSGMPMKIPALTNALAETKLIKNGSKFDLIGFDACLMGSVEIAKALSNYSDYMIASEEVEPGDGWSYDFLNDLGKENRVKSTEALGRSIIDKYISYYNNYSYDVDLSLALINLKKMQPLTRAVDGLFSELNGAINEDSFSQYSRLMTREKVYGYNGRDSQSYDLVDLMDLCGSLHDRYSNKVDDIKKVFDDLVVYSKSNMDDTNGLSVYFLNYNKEEAEKMMVNYKDVAFSDEYYNFLSKYKDFVTGNKRVSKTVYKDLNEDKKDGAIEIELADELVDNYRSGEIIVFRKLGENRFMPVYRGSNVELDGNKLKATTYDLQFVIEVDGKDGKEYGWNAFYEKERTNEYADYVTFGVLWYDDGGEIGFMPKSYEMHVRVPNGSTEGQVRDIRVQSETDLASKMSFDPEKIKTIEFTIGSYKLFNEAGELDYNMESYKNDDGSAVLYGTGVNLEENEDYKIRLVGLDFDFGNMYEGEFDSLNDYYAAFVVHDTQGESHRLNLIHIDK